MRAILLLLLWTVHGALAATNTFPCQPLLAARVKRALSQSNSPWSTNTTLPPRELPENLRPLLQDPARDLSLLFAAYTQGFWIEVSDVKGTSLVGQITKMEECGTGGPCFVLRNPKKQWLLSANITDRASPFDRLAAWQEAWRVLQLSAPQRLGNFEWLTDSYIHQTPIYIIDRSRNNLTGVVHLLRPKGFVSKSVEVILFLGERRRIKFRRMEIEQIRHVRNLPTHLSLGPVKDF
jgi:hypothetical protein